MATLDWGEWRIVITKQGKMRREREREYVGGEESLVGCYHQGGFTFQLHDNESITVPQSI